MNRVCVWWSVAVATAGLGVAGAAEDAPPPPPYDAVSYMALPSGGPPVPAAFTISPAEVQSAIAKGQTAVEKRHDWTGLCEPYVKMPHWSSGKKKGTIHESKVWCQSLGGTPVALTAYDAAKAHRELALPSGVAEHGAEISSIAFVIRLVSAPFKPLLCWKPNRLGDADDVEPDDYFLSDDKGNQAHFTFDCILIPMFVRKIKFESPVGYDFPGTVTVGDDEIEVREERRYTTTYRVRFPVRNPDGTSIFAPDAKKLILRIVTPNGDQTAEFDLPAKGR